MAIFQLNNALGPYMTIQSNDVDGHNLLVNRYGTKLSSEWKELSFVWNKEDGNLKRPIFLHLGYIMVCSTNVMEAIQMSSFRDVEFLPIDVEGDKYYIINVCRQERDSLNIRKSQIEYFSDNSIKWIKEFVFCKDVDAFVFRIPEIKAALFCNECFHSLVDSGHFDGIVFRPCKISGNSFLKSIFNK